MFFFLEAYGPQQFTEQDLITFQKEAQELLLNKEVAADSKEHEEGKEGQETKMVVTSEEKEGVEKEERSCQQIFCQSCQVALIHSYLYINNFIPNFYISE